MIRLDTHVVVWLYAGEIERFDVSARQRLDHDDLVISPIVELELQYLHEVGRLTVAARAITTDLAERIGLGRSEEPTAAVVAAALALDWTRDPFDRLIVADALADDTELLTRDATIRHHCALAVW